MWYLRRGVILTKDNLAKQNWQRNQQCCFCHENETIRHLFFNCRFTQMVWASVYAAWGIPKPRNVIESRAAIFREVDKFDLWNTQLTIKAFNHQ